MRYPTVKVVQVGGPGGMWQFRVIDPSTGAVEEVSGMCAEERHAVDIGITMLTDLLSSAHNRRRAANFLREMTRT